MPSTLTFLLTLPLAVAAAVAGSLWARRLALLAGVAHALGAASVRVALGLPIGGEADPLWVGALPILSLRIDAGLQLLGALLAGGASIVAWRAGGRDRAAAVIAALAASAIVVTLRPLASVTGWPPVLAAAVAIGAGATVVGAPIVALARFGAKRIVGEASAADGAATGFRGVGVPGVLLAGGAALALAAPHLDLVFAGAMLAAVAAEIACRRAGTRRLPLFPIAVIGALSFAGYYLHVIAGPVGVSLAALPDVPLSAAAQAMILPALAVAAAGFFTAWPVRPLLPGPWLAPVGAALLLRIGVEALPLGIEGWRTVAIPLGVMAAWGAALTARPLLLASAGAWMACFASAGGGPAGAWLLCGVPLLAVPLRRGWSGPPAEPGSFPVRRIVVMTAGALGAAFALDGLLRTEVVYAVLAAGAAALSAVYISRAPT